MFSTPLEEARIGLSPDRGNTPSWSYSPRLGSSPFVELEVQMVVGLGGKTVAVNVGREPCEFVVKRSPSPASSHVSRATT